MSYLRSLSESTFLTLLAAKTRARDESNMTGGSGRTCGLFKNSLQHEKTLSYCVLV